MSEHISTERMHDAVDGLLPAHEVARIKEHVAGCSACREEYARISEVVQELRALPASARVPDGVWQGVRDRIRQADVGAGEGEADVVPLRPAREHRRRLSLSIPQLAAAAVLVASVSAATVWMAMSGGTDVAGPAAVEPPSARGAAARVVSNPSERYGEAIAEMEALVEQGRDVLAPETVETLEQSLAAIDEAIGEVRRALQEDPSSSVLERMLVNHQRSKLMVLKQAAAAVQARS